MLFVILCLGLSKYLLTFYLFLIYTLACFLYFHFNLPFVILCFSLLKYLLTFYLFPIYTLTFFFAFYFNTLFFFLDYLD